MDMKKYDLIIVGGGPGGYVAAIHARHYGLNVALIEKQAIGGVCLNFGCIPTKSLLKSAKVYKTMMNSESYGIELADKAQIKPNWLSIVRRKDNIVKQLTSGVKMLLEKNGVEVYNGWGYVKNATTVEVNDELLETKNIILATGARPIIPPIPGVKEAIEKNIVLTSKEILGLEAIPESLVIIGGGIIGIEFATIFSTFNTNVTIIEKADNILLNIDDEVRNAYLRILKKAKIKIITQATVTKISNNEVTYQKDDKETKITSDKILMSVGMKANIDKLETLNLKMNTHGINVNDKMETNIKGIYAIGDVNGQMMLAHVASAEGIVAVDNISGKTNKIDYNKVPAAVYGLMEISWVGISEQMAKLKNLDYKVSKFPLAANGKALADGDCEGFIKIISDNKYGEILGMHILASNATDLISEAVVTMELEGTIYELAKSIHPHPTLSEIIMEAAHVAVNKPIHII